MAIDFGDLASRYATARLDQAMQPFTDPEAYLNNRLQQNYGVDLNGNVQSRTTTIQQNADGTGTVTTKHEIGAQDQTAPVEQPSMYSLAPQQNIGGLGLRMPQQTVGQQPMFNVGNIPQITEQPTTPQSVANPQQVQAEAQLPQQLSQSATPQVTPQVAEQPQTTAPMGQMPNIGQVPTPGPGVQLAGPMVQGAVPGTTTTQPQANQVTWQQELESAQMDPNKLWAFTQNLAYPEDARKFAAGLYANQMDVQKKTDQALKTFTNAFANGDVQAQNQIMRDLRRDTEEGSLVKAVLYARLGLADLARQEQIKLGAGNKIGRMLVNGESYAVDTDAKGFVKRAWDANGAPANDTTLSMLNASGTLQGTHQYSFTGETQLDPKTGQEVRQRQNNINGTIEYVYVTGPKQGEIYKGGTPVPKSVQTAATKQENKERISANWAGPIAANRSSGAYVGKFNSENNANLAIRNYGGGRVSIIDNNAGGAEVTPDRTGRIDFVPNNAKVKTEVAPPAPTPTTTTNLIQQPRFREPGFETETPDQFKQREKNTNEANKKIAQKNAETVAGAGLAANTVEQAQHAIDILNSGKHNIGPELSILSGRGPVAQAVGTQLETESARNTKAIMDVVRSIGGAASQSTIKGHLTNDQLKFLTDNKPTEKSDPLYTKQWLEKSIKMIQDAQRAAEAQARSGGAAPNPVLAPPGSRDNPVKLD